MPDPRTRHWTPDHLHLAQTVEAVRAGLRTLAARLPDPERRELGRLAARLTAGLKARGRTATEPGGEHGTA